MGDEGLAVHAGARAQHARTAPQRPGRSGGLPRPVLRRLAREVRLDLRALPGHLPPALPLHAHAPQRAVPAPRLLEARAADGRARFKELYFPDIILEFHPELVKDGKICANEPFWWEFTKVKYTEFFEEFPEVAGIIVAPATGESRVSIASNRCTCELCRNTTRQDWFRRLALSMHEPIHAAGRKLVIRDFVFDAKTHADIAAAMVELPADVIISLKSTPHDFYPTFPDNPRIGHIAGHEQWVEYDAMGQYFGWGIGIAAITEDYRRRLTLARAQGVSGVIVRTDWESLDGHSAFQTLNFVNLYAFSALANDLSADTGAIYRDWLGEQGWLLDAAGSEPAQAAIDWVRAIMEQTWSVVRRTAFIHDCVFSDSSQLPVSVEHALWLAEEKNSLKDWLPASQPAQHPGREGRSPGAGVAPAGAGGAGPCGPHATSQATATREL
jgi:hypothetical protein